MRILLFLQTVYHHVLWRYVVEASLTERTVRDNVYSQMAFPEYLLVSLD
jgi:hypothetical protein